MIVHTQIEWARVLGSARQLALRHKQSRRLLASNVATFTISKIGDNPLPVLRSLAVSTSNGLGITLTGIHFVAGAKVQWNGVTRQPTTVNGTQVKFSITTSEFRRPAIVTVTNPGPGGGVSNELLFDPKVIFLPLQRR